MILPIVLKIFRCVVLVSVFFAAFQFVSVQATAKTLLFSDDFNDGDISNWTVQRNQQWRNPGLPCMNSGQPALWEVIHGELGITIQGSGCTTEITPNGLDLSAVSAYEFSFDWRYAESTLMDRNVTFFWHDDHNWYGLKTLGDTLLVQKVVDGQSRALANPWTTYQFVANQTYHFSIQFRSNGEIITTINGQEILRSRDTTPSIYGFKTVGLQASSGAISRSVSFFDNVLVHQLSEADENTLGVQALKQHDPRWKLEEYDHATRWSDNPTIGRWGCAMTSLVMIMRYHGMKTLLDGTELTPSSFNAWLKQQPDGYLGEGALNWLAGMRLTRLLSERDGTLKLEYRAVPGSSLQTARQEIALQKPVVLQIPGHFMVADGITSTAEDVYLKDPAYAYERFSQHKTSLLSTRLFQPSQTDLSYILIAHVPEITVTLTDKRGDLIPTVTTLETITAIDFPESLESEMAHFASDTSPTMAFTVLPKPTDGIYTLTITQSTFQLTAATLLTYSPAGEPTLFPITQWMGPEPSQFQLTYQRDGTSSLHPLATLISWRRLLAQFHQHSHIQHTTIYRKLDSIAAAAERETQGTRTVYTQQLLQLLKLRLDHWKPYLSSASHQELSSQLTLLTPAP